MTDFGHSRRNFLRVLTTSSLLSAAPLPLVEASARTAPPRSGPSVGSADDAPRLHDGPSSSRFATVKLPGNRRRDDLPRDWVSERMAEAAAHAPVEGGTAWGLPFELGEQVLLLRDDPVSVAVTPLAARWVVFLHTSDELPPPSDEQGRYLPPFKGAGQLNTHVADYVVLYADGSTLRVPVRERREIGMFQQIWGENCTEAVAHHKPRPVRPHHEQPAASWGQSQTRVTAADRGQWIDWLWAWENPHPERPIHGFRFEPAGRTALVVSGISAGDVDPHPLRWRTRRKAVLTLPDGTTFDPTLDADGLLSQIQLDLGQVISVTPRLRYPDAGWEDTYNNQVPEVSDREVVVEYTAHPDAAFHLAWGVQVPVSALDDTTAGGPLRRIAPATQTVKLRVLEAGSTRPVAVKLHVHGAAGEYLAPLDRHRLPNDAWFEDYSTDFVHRGAHNCTYIPGETVLRLPVGTVYLEVSKGFEVRPVRRAVTVTPSTDEITITLERVLPWRQKGWVTADTHVHFLSPDTALLEGAGEGVNVVNLLASQWGELMTNVGDFDGKTTHGARDAGGDGEYLVRVGTENRQHVLGHISLLGYEGAPIVPMTTGGPDESALGDPIEVLLTEWARQCRRQDGVVVLPHFPNPRLENAAAIVSGDVDGVEMTSWGSLYGGISPYSLADWYRYLNCGYFVAAVGGTDKMSAGTAVGTVRTYALLEPDQPFTYDAWKDAVRQGRTFVTYGPLVHFAVDGRRMGSRFSMPAGGGTVDVTWEVASVTVPMSRVELIVNGEVREDAAVLPDQAEGHWSIRVDRSSWLALLVRGHYPDKPEIVTAHTSPVMIDVEGSAHYAAADAVTILDQIEGAMAYLDTLGTRADDRSYKRMRLVLEGAHRRLHNRMHQLGHYHRHGPLHDHPEHHDG